MTVKIGQETNFKPVATHALKVHKSGQEFQGEKQLISAFLTKQWMLH